jgi:hypothetical protein
VTPCIIFLKAQGFRQKIPISSHRRLTRYIKVSKLKVGHRVEVEFSSEDNNGKDYYSNVKCVKITSDTQKIIVHFDKKKTKVRCEHL